MSEVQNPAIQNIASLSKTYSGSLALAKTAQSKLATLKSQMVETINTMDEFESDLMAQVFADYEARLRTQRLRQFYLDVQSLAPSDSRQRDQYKIYRDYIADYLTEYKLYNQKEAYEQLKNPSDTSASRAMANLIDATAIFAVTYKTRGSTIGYPAFQFDQKNGFVKPILKQVLAALGGKYSDWDLLFWFNAYNDDLACKPLEAIDKPELKNILLDIAESEREGWV